MDNQDVLDRINRNLYKISESLESINKKMEDSSIRESLNNIAGSLEKQNKLIFDISKEVI